MNVTFLIGNGFDIHLGLKTQYTDFYDTYIESNKDRPSGDSIKIFCELIKNNYQTWADFEMAFAKNAFGTKNDVKNILGDFTSKFAQYLSEQVALCNYSDNEIPNKFRHFLINGYKNLERRDKQIIQFKYQSIAENIIINFINFNYTDTLNNLIKIYKESNNSSNLRTFNIGGTTLQFSEKIGSSLNIHGQLNDYIIIGIDSQEQFEDNKLRSDKSVAKYCVKSKYNEDVGNSVVERDFINIINSSNIIYAYGVSFGKSDQSRWNIIAEWLKSNSNNKLIIYKYKTNFNTQNTIYRRNLLDAIEEAKDEYLNILGFDENEYETYYNQIFVIDSDDVLDIKLIKDEADEELKETAEAV